jgi:hypothetical protein
MKKKMTQLYYIDIWSMIDCPFQTWNIHQKIFLEICKVQQGPSWLWSYGCWIYNYLCNQYLSPLKLWVRISIRASCTLLCDKVCQWLVTGRWYSPGPPVSSTNKIDHHDITEISLKVALNTIKQTNKQSATRHNYIFTVTAKYFLHWIEIFVNDKGGKPAI